MVAAIGAFVTALSLVVFGGGMATAAANATWNSGLVKGGPSLTITSVDNPLGETSKITVKGSGFTQSPEGVYVNFGSVTESKWRPSEGASTDTRRTHQTAWVSTDADTTQPDQYNWTGKGTFTVTLTVEAPYTAFGDEFHVYTENSHGVALAANEQAVRVPYTGKTIAPPDYGGNGHITQAFKDKSGTLTVDGAGYPLTPDTGIYVSVGSLADKGWKPSGGFNASTRKASDTVWVYPGGPDKQNNQMAKLNADGTFSITLDASKLPDNPPSGYHFAAYSIGAHGIVVKGAESEWKLSAR